MRAKHKTFTIKLPIIWFIFEYRIIEITIIDKYEVNSNDDINDFKSIGQRQSSPVHFQSKIPRSLTFHSSINYQRCRWLKQPYYCTQATFRLADRFIIDYNITLDELRDSYWSPSCRNFPSCQNTGLSLQSLDGTGNDGRVGIKRVAIVLRG